VVTVDDAKLEAFMAQALGDLGAAISGLMVYLGDQLGLYKTMAGVGPVTPAALAAKTETNERYVREWLDNQAAGGYVTYDAASRTYELPPEQALALADEDNPAFLPGGFKFRHLFVSPHAEQRKLFYGLNIEMSYQAPRFAQSAFALELRPILGVRDLGWEFIINPIVDVSFGPSGAAAFAPALRLAHDVGGEVMLGVEYYANIGPIGNFSPVDGQGHNVFAVIDFKAFGLDVNFGLGFGLTDASDKIVTKLIIGRAF